MKLAVQEDIIRETSQCQYDFRCLASGLAEVCDVNRGLSGRKALFVFKKETRKCDYSKAYGQFSVCRCPTRAEIFIKFDF